MQTQTSLLRESQYIKHKTHISSTQSHTQPCTPVLPPGERPQAPLASLQALRLPLTSSGVLRQSPPMQRAGRCSLLGICLFMSTSYQLQAHRALCRCVLTQSTAQRLSRGTGEQLKLLLYGESQQKPPSWEAVPTAPAACHSEISL